MFNLKKKKKKHHVMPFTDEALKSVMTLLETVGLTVEYGFQHVANSPETYSYSSMLEWSERGFGTRFYISLGANGRVVKIFCVNLHEQYKAVPQDRLDEVNAQLAEVLLKENQ